MDSERNDQTTKDDDIEAIEKPGGLGADGTIPPNPDGVAAGFTGEPSSFEPEEDQLAPVPRGQDG